MTKKFINDVKVEKNVYLLRAKLARYNYKITDIKNKQAIILNRLNELKVQDEK